MSRSAVWDALHARHCYGTTGAHIIVLFHVNDHLPGSEVKVSEPDAPREVTWRAIGTGNIKRVDLLRRNDIAKQWFGQGWDDISATFEYSEPISKEEWWYLRVIQQDGEIAWTSPIWIEPVIAPLPK